MATEVGQPDLVYKFMDLAHHQQVCVSHCVCVCMCVYVCICMCICMCKLVGLEHHHQVCASLCACVCARMCVCVCVRVHMYMCVKGGWGWGGLSEHSCLLGIDCRPVGWLGATTEAIVPTPHTICRPASCAPPHPC